METIIDFKSIVNDINDQSKELLRKYDINKNIPFKIETDISIKNFYYQFEIHINTIVNEIILQLKAYSTSLIHQQKKKELVIAYNSFTNKNKEIYNILYSSCKDRDDAKINLNSSQILKENQSELKKYNKEESDLLDELNQYKKQKHKLIEKRQRLSYLIQMKDERNQKLQKILLVIIASLMAWIIYYQLINQL